MAAMSSYTGLMDSDLRLVEAQALCSDNFPPHTSEIANSKGKIPLSNTSLCISKVEQPSQNEAGPSWSSYSKSQTGVSDLLNHFEATMLGFTAPITSNLSNIRKLFR